MVEVTKTYLPNPKKYYEYIEESFQSRIVTNNGPLVNLLEKRLVNYLNVKNLILVSNGTLALQIAYKVLGLEKEIVTTPFTFNATAGSILWQGLSPIFADIDNLSFNISSDEIEKKINKNTSAIVPVHIFGNACKVNEIDAIAKKYGLRVVYDAAHAFGVDYKGQSLLNYGDISILSFHATKLFHTIEGGAIITNDSNTAKKIRSMINFGYSSPFNSTINGINAKMSEFHAAMGLAVLDDIEYILKQRKDIWLRYISEIKAPIRFQKINNNANCNYHYFPVVFDSEKELLVIEKSLLKNGIRPRRYFYPSLDVLDYFNIYGRQNCHNSRDLSLRLLCLPIFPDMNEDIQSKIIKIINNAL